MLRNKTKNLEFFFDSIIPTKICCNEANIKCYEYLSVSSNFSITSSTNTSYEPVLYCDNHIKMKKIRNLCKSCIFKKFFFNSKNYVTRIIQKDEICDYCKINQIEIPCCHYIMFCFNKCCDCCSLDCGRRRSEYRYVCKNCIITKWKKNCSYVCPPYKFQFISNLNEKCNFCEKKLINC